MADYLPEDFVNMTKIMVAGQIAAADADAKRYKIENNIHLLDNPVDKIKEKIVKNLVKGTLLSSNKIYQTGKRTIQWGKDVKKDFPQIRQNFINKPDNDLNIPRKWNEALNAELFRNYIINKPNKSITIDYNGNVTTNTPSSLFRRYRNSLNNFNQ